MTRSTTFLITLQTDCLASPVIAAAAEEGEHAATGIGGDLALWALVAFVLFFLTCYKLLGEWAARSLAERERTEKELIAQAEHKNQLAQEALSEQRGRLEAIGEEIDERIAEAHRDADHTKNDIAAVGRREADVLRNRALGEINRTRNQALNDLFSTMAARVVAQTEARVKERLDDSAHDRLIDEALNHFARS